MLPCEVLVTAVVHPLCGRRLRAYAFRHVDGVLHLKVRLPEGRRVLEDLVRESDAVYSNLRGDQPSKLRLTYEDLKGINPRIVCVSLSGFGMTGPRATEAGYDYVVQAMTGWMSLTGDPDGPPTKSGLSLVDLSGGYVSALALMAGLHRRLAAGTASSARPRTSSLAR